MPIRGYATGRPRMGRAYPREPMWARITWWTRRQPGTTMMPRLHDGPEF